MKTYLNLLNTVLEKGTPKRDRTGVGTLSIFGHDMRFNLQEGLPVVTTKKIHLKSVIHELLWFLRGDTNIAYLKQNGVSIWDAWADDDGNLGPVYGQQWRAWKTMDGRVIDQMQELIDAIKAQPDSRRLLVNAWNVGELEHMALPPCHLLFQFYVSEGRLSCKLTQRSADVFLGVPFNICSYAILTHMVAQQCNLSVGEFIWSGGDCHIYHNHLEQVKEQITRSPYPLPELHIKRKPDSLFSYHYEDFEIRGYRHHPAIRAPIAV